MAEVGQRVVHNNKEWVVGRIRDHMALIQAGDKGGKEKWVPLGRLEATDGDKAKLKKENTNNIVEWAKHEINSFKATHTENTIDSWIFWAGEIGVPRPKLEELTAKWINAVGNGKALVKMQTVMVIRGQLMKNKTKEMQDAMDRRVKTS